MSYETNDTFLTSTEYQMRTLVSHKVNGLNENLTIAVLDEPGHGGACHRYGIDIKGGDLMKAGGDLMKAGSCIGPLIAFQNGPIQEHGVNGVSNESLLAIVIDRLQGFQSGEFKCRENAIALTKLEEAMHWLHHRTRERVARGVEGTTAV